jgi:uncharacterized protein (DUF433 family)
MDWRERVSINPRICHGIACIKGRRVIVSVVVAGLAEGDSPESLVENFLVAPKDIQAAMLFAADRRKTASCPSGTRSPDAIQKCVGIR